MGPVGAKFTGSDIVQLIFLLISTIASC